LFYIVDSVVKEEQGVRFLCESTPQRPQIELIYHRCLKFGEFSARPYLLGQAADDSTLACVLGLYYDLCRCHALNAAKLMRRAYPGDEAAGQWDAVAWRRVLDVAQWQETRFPNSWTPEAILGLLVSLRSQRRTHLARVLAQRLGMFDETSPGPFSE